MLQLARWGQLTFLTWKQRRLQLLRLRRAQLRTKRRTIDGQPHVATFDSLEEKVYGRMTTSSGPEGKSNLTPRCWFCLNVAGMSRSAIWMVRVQLPLE